MDSDKAPEVGFTNDKAGDNPLYAKVDVVEVKALSSGGLDSGGDDRNVIQGPSTNSLAELLPALTGESEKAAGLIVADIVVSQKEDYEASKFSLFQACALNTMNMFGTGPFITLPFLISATSPPGPHALIGYSLAALFCLCDSLVWGELGSLMPVSGGSYVYLREAFGRETWGQLMSFLFLWQFLISAPLEIASGFVAMSQYLGYITGVATVWQHSLIGSAFCAFSVLFLHGDISVVSKYTVALWTVTILAILFTLVSGLSHFQPENLKLPSDAFDNPGAFIISLGLAARIGIYDFTGYYDVCHIGSEVKNPRRTIPVSCVVTCWIVCIVYFMVYMAVMGYLPWFGPDGYVELTNNSEGANYIMSIYAERMIGESFAQFFTLVVVVTIFGSCFSLVLGYAMIPYSAAKDGYFFKIFAHEHPTKKGLADYSLLILGVISAICCFIDLEDLINMMLIPRLFLQYVAQAVGLMLLRKEGKTFNEAEIFRVPLYPIPVIISIVGFSYCFITSDNWIVSGDKPMVEGSILYSLVGVGAYMMWAKKQQRWPYQAK